MADKNTPKAAEPADRLDSYFEKLAEMEKKNVDAAYLAVDEYSKLMKASIEYTAKLSDEWRRMALESSRRAQSMMQSWV